MFIFPIRLVLFTTAENKSYFFFTVRVPGRGGSVELTVDVWFDLTSTLCGVVSSPYPGDAVRSLTQYVPVPIVTVTIPLESVLTVFTSFLHALSEYIP